MAAIKRDTHSRKSERGSAILAAMIMVAAFAVALSFATGKRNPAKKRMERVLLAKTRIQVLSEVLSSYYRENGSFPNSLKTVIGQGRIDKRTLQDPFTPGKTLKYKILRHNPDIAIVYSIGPNRRDDGGKKHDIRRRLSGKRIGSAETNDRFRLIRRALIGKSSAGSNLGEDNLDTPRATLLRFADFYWSFFKRYEKQQRAQRWLPLLAGIAILLPAYYGGYSYDLPTNGGSVFQNLRTFYQRDEAKLLIHSIFSSALFNTFTGNNLNNDPAIIQRDIDTLKSLNLPKAKEKLYISAMNYFKEITQHVSDGGAPLDSVGKTLLAKAFRKIRKQMIIAMLSSQTGQDQSSTKDFISSFDRMDGPNGLVLALGLPSKFAYDAWGSVLKIDKTSSPPKIRSAGPDRNPTTKDDRVLKRKHRKRK